jgi:hypothetical protein
MALTDLGKFALYFVISAGVSFAFPVFKSNIAVGLSISSTTTSALTDPGVPYLTLVPSK